jgi:hypothetical protein
VYTVDELMAPFTQAATQRATSAAPRNRLGAPVRADPAERRLWWHDPNEMIDDER